jgi:hypothetical protein
MADGDATAATLMKGFNGCIHAVKAPVFVVVAEVEPETIWNDFNVLNQVRHLIDKVRNGWVVEQTYEGPWRSTASHAFLEIARLTPQDGT